MVTLKRRPKLEARAVDDHRSEHEPGLVKKLWEANDRREKAIAECREQLDKQPTGTDCDPVNRPDHYVLHLADGRRIESLSIIRAVLESADGNWHGIQAKFLGDALKYLLRVGRKGDGQELKDIGKAIKYLTWLYEDIEIHQHWEGKLSTEDLSQPLEYYTTEEWS